MDSFISEVNEDLRADRMANFWQKYGKFIIILAVMILVASGSYSWWHAYNNTQMEEKFDKLYSTLQELDNGDADYAKNDYPIQESPYLELQIITQANLFHASLSEPELKNSQDLENQSKLILQELNKITSSKNFPNWLQEIAALDVIRISLSLIAFDKSYDNQEINAYIDTNLDWFGNKPQDEIVFRPLYLEQKAINLLRTGKPEDAKEVISKIKNDLTVINSARARADKIYRVIENHYIKEASTQ